MNCATFGQPLCTVHSSQPQPGLLHAPDHIWRVGRRAAMHKKQRRKLHRSVHSKGDRVQDAVQLETPLTSARAGAAPRRNLEVVVLRVVFPRSGSEVVSELSVSDSETGETESELALPDSAKGSLSSLSQIVSLSSATNCPGTNLVVDVKLKLLTFQPASSGLVLDEVVEVLMLVMVLVIVRVDQVLVLVRVDMVVVLVLVEKVLVAVV